MKVHYGIQNFSGARNPIVTTGTFDGVHIGHSKILERLKKSCIQEKGESVLITFHPHPRLVLFPENNDLRLLNSQDEKLELLEKAGLDHVIIHPFTREFSRTSSLEFVRDILVNQIGVHKLIIGYNHHFGRNREGSFESLQEYAHVYDFKLEEIPAEEVDHVNVSSTKIRNAIMEGEIDKANSFLNHPYGLRGKVVPGEKIGRELGFPTANIIPDDKYKLIPKDGAYAVMVKSAGQNFAGMMNIGFRPTVGGSKNRSIEVHLLNFEGDLYDQSIEVAFVQRLRDERSFENLEELRKQLTLDSNKTRELVVL